MQIDWGLVAIIAGPVLALLVGAVLSRIFEKRPRLVAYLGHVSAHRLNANDGNFTNIYAHSLVIRNMGKTATKNVRFSHNYLPDYNLLPYTAHKIVDITGDGKEIVIPSLVSGKQVTISYLYFPPITWDQINGQIK